MKKIITISIVITLILLLLTPVVGCQEKPPPQPKPTPMPTPTLKPAPAPAPTAEPHPAPTPPTPLPEPVPAPAPAPLESVKIAPVEVAAGETQQIEAIATDEQGKRLSQFDTAWKITDKNAGYITQEGLFTAGKVAGDFTDAIEVQAIQGELTCTAVASVTILPSPLEQVAIVPNLAELGIEMTQQFVAVGADKYGNRISNLVFSWSVENSGGTIDEAGLFTAGATSGNYTDTVKVEATQGSVARSATADVAVEPDRILFISGKAVPQYRVALEAMGMLLEDGDIYIMDADGGNIKRLTDTSATEGGLSCSPDSQRIVYNSGGSRSKIMVMNTDGSGELCLSGDDTKTRNYSSDWSPDGTRIVFISYSSKEEDSDIYVVDVDGGNLTQLTDTSDYIESSPDWSPDGTRIVFSSGSHKEGYYETVYVIMGESVRTARAPDIYVMDADGGNLTQLTDTRRASSPDWSPDGTRITYRVKGELWEMNADGSDQKRSSIEAGSLSPDGTQIVRASRYGIYVINAGGTNERQLCMNKEMIEYVAPALSPDRSKIIFVSREYKLGLKSYPSGLLGERVAISVKQHKRDEIYIMDADGSNKVRLTDNSERFISSLRWVPRKKGIEVNEESVIIPTPVH